MTKVRLYQDIDGCLNASHNARVWRTPEDGVNAGYQCGMAYLRHMDDGRLREVLTGGWAAFYEPPKFRMEWNERLISALNELDVELAWTTTWREDAREVGTLMGLLHEPQRVLHPLNGLTTYPSIHWKYDAILYEQDHEPGPFIAIDDEWMDVSKEDMYEALTSIGGLVIAPDPNIGVTPAHIESMEAYIEEHS